ncbi:hypothetical protein PVAND_006503 [Polypedilum vanderplanki]|uniref:Uncharacterized protein n=1 Tax=Polypedilum vanderplanki TaxID=319348 RepID=A0A9J6C3U6_POLVA|nr:hypothetical protein PVAND_006503 [Polypedilum vanderplanki]
MHQVTMKRSKNCIFTAKRRQIGRKIILSATTDLKVVVEGKCKEKKEQTAIIDKLNIKMSDNTINKTNDLNDLRHQQQQQHQKYKTYNDLQSTCQKQSRRN